MNLYVESLANYIKQQWDETLTKNDGTHEARFIIESLDPHSVCDLFTQLEEHRLQWIQQRTLECHFRVATGLWRQWCIKFNQQQLIEKISKYAMVRTVLIFQKPKQIRQKRVCRFG